MRALICGRWFFIKMIIHYHAHWNIEAGNSAHVGAYPRHWVRRTVTAAAILTIINTTGSHCFARVPHYVRIPPTSGIYIISKGPRLYKLNRTFAEII